MTTRCVADPKGPTLTFVRSCIYYHFCELHFKHKLCLFYGFPGGTMVKNLPANAEGTGSFPGSERSPGEGNGNPLQYSCLGNPVVRGAWWTAVHWIKESYMTEHSHMPLFTWIFLWCCAQGCKKLWDVNGWKIWSSIVCYTSFQFIVSTPNSALWYRHILLCFDLLFFLHISTFYIFLNHLSKLQHDVSIYSLQGKTCPIFV